jgi:hypothetical protein
VESLSRWFEKRFLPPEHAAGTAEGVTTPVFTVIGSGGKTSLIRLLAQSQRRRKVLVSPTTKMYPLPGIPAWVSLAGLLNRETGKLEALPAELLERLIPGYDLVLLEGDGSRGLPLKGWAEHEPVVPPYTTLCIGVIPLSPLGKKITPEIVFRLPLFRALCGAAEGDTLCPAHLAAVITAGGRAEPSGGLGGAGADEGAGGGKGLFAAARGRKLLFINQVEDERRRRQARELAALLPDDFMAGLEGIICGSVELDQVEVLQQRL